MRDMKFFKEGKEDFPTLKVPSQCILILLAVVRLREGKELGSEEGNGVRK